MSFEDGPLSLNDLNLPKKDIEDRNDIKYENLNEQILLEPHDDFNNDMNNSLENLPGFVENANTVSEANFVTNN